MEVKGQEATKVEGVTAELLTETSYGDYELDLDGLPEEIKSDNVNAVVVKTNRRNRLWYASSGKYLER